MPAADDYSPPAPLWLVVLAAVLTLDNGKGVSPTVIADEVGLRMPGRFRRVSSVFDCVRRMSDDGTLRLVRTVELGGAAHASYYAVTDAGSSMFFAARAAAASALALPHLDNATNEPKEARK